MRFPMSMCEGMGENDMFRIERQNDREAVLRQNAVLTEAGAELEYLTFPLLEETGAVKHLFTTRLGGVSGGEFASMNLSAARGDAESNVLENHRRIARVLGCDVGDMVASHQTHTTNIRRVTSRDRGKGIVRERDYENVDGMVTEEPGVVLATYYADCVPLYFVDPVNRAIGLAHSGWRGTVDGMGERMVRTMSRCFGSRPEELLVGIGPSICRDCYEVGEDVGKVFAEKFGGDVAAPGGQPGKYQLDLWLANEMLLERAGVPKSHIQITDICTCHNSDYLFSHRASQGRRGNMGAFLALR